MKASKPFIFDNSLYEILHKETGVDATSSGSITYSVPLIKNYDLKLYKIVEPIS